MNRPPFEQPNEPSRAQQPSGQHFGGQHRAPNGWLALGAIFGLIGVAAGAFGAHVLTARGIVPSRLEVWRTAASYQQLHAVLIVAVALASKHPRPTTLRWALALLVAGIVVFSGSLYVLVLADLPWLGAITPIGGASLLAGWLALLVFALRSRT